MTNILRVLSNFFRRRKAGIVHIRGLLSRGPDGSIFLELKASDDLALDLFDRLDDRIKRLDVADELSSAFDYERKTISLLVSRPGDTQKKERMLTIVKTSK